ncbi:hypothetical protein QJS10_CPA06g01454 [Acorus calamus]|uniref:Cytochrome b561 and DOMON domain-containing protein n=1 Tax=Acorus calamus TaxID=4465 RepID=A0AAV9EKA7_ACOCL|nr:hypothetical protein QJS10_CPA06g01454 [Acorus calamus]
MQHTQSGPNTWSFILSAPDNGAYISVGFSPNGKMVGSSAVAGWIVGGGPGVVKQYYLGGETSKECEPDKGELELVNGTTMIISQSSNLYLVFQINATQPKTRLIYAVGPKNGSPASGNYYLPEHKDMISTSINYAVGESSDEGEPYTRLRQGHGLLALLGWGVLIPIGVTIARYFKRHDPAWFYGHLSVQGIGFGLGLAGVITGFSLEDKLSVEVDTHKGLGIFILVLGCLQVMAVLARPGKGSKVRKYWNWYHHYLGRLCIAVAIGNIFYGIHLGEDGNSWNIAYGIVLGLWFLVVAVLEMMRCMSD